MNLKLALPTSASAAAPKLLISTLCVVWCAVLLAACGTPPIELPTAVVLPTQAISPTTAVSTERTAALAPSVVPTETPLIPLMSSAEAATHAAQIVPNFTPPPTPDLSNLLGGAVDLAAVAVGDTVSLIGILTTEDTTAVVTNAEGSSVRLDLPVALAEPLLNKRVYVVGIVTSLEGGIRLQLVTIQEVTEAPTLSAVVDLPFEVTAEGTAEALPGVENVRLALNLTALAAYDQLVEQISDQLGERQWISVSGNPGIGWSFSFYAANDSSVIIYNVLLDGSVQIQPGIPPLGAAEIFALDRAALTVDSDRVLELYTTNGGTDEPETLVFLLRAIDAQSAQWSVLNVEGQTQLAVDAISGTVAR